MVRAMVKRTALTSARIRVASLWLMGPAYVIAGVNHFVHPDFYVSIMPPWIPWHHELVLVSGLAEIALGVLVVPRATRRLAGYGLAALLVAIFPANVQMLLDGHEGTPTWALWLRLPLQAVLIAWALWATATRDDGDPRARIA
jgi:uncharacterized membrane protein